MNSHAILKIVDIEFDEVPLELVSYDSGSNKLVIEADSSAEGRIRVEFQGVRSFSYLSTDDYDMEMFCVGDFFTASIYEMNETADARQARRYFFPTHEGVWEIRSENGPSISQIS